MFKLLIVSALISVAASHAIEPAAKLAPPHAVPLAAPAPVAVPALAAVPTLTAVHQQRLIPQPPAVHSVASPTTVLQTVQTGTAVVGHQKVGDQVVGKTPDVNGYAFRSDVRHDAPAYAPVVAAPLAVAGPAPVLAAPAPVAVAAPAPIAAAPALAPAALAGPQTIHPAPPALSKSYATEIGHTVAHDHIVTSPVIKNTVHSPVFGSQPIVAQVPVAAPLPAPVLAPAPLPLAAPLPAY